MREYLNENTLFNTVAMFVAGSKDLLLVLEGPDDQLLLKSFCHPDLQLIAATGGREQVLAAARLAGVRGLDRARFLVDRDYDAFSGSTDTELDNVFVSDSHDCFLDLLTSDPSLLQRVIEVHTDSARRRPNYAGLVPDPEVIEREAFRLGSGISTLRIIDAEQGLSIDFKRFRFGGLKVCEFSVERIVKIALTRSQYDGENLDEIVAQAVLRYDEVIQMRPIPIGDHDLFSALARVLKRYKVDIRDEQLQKGCILNATCTALMGTTWYRNIQDWCSVYGKQGFRCEPLPAVTP